MSTTTVKILEACSTLPMAQYNEVRRLLGELESQIAWSQLRRVDQREAAEKILRNVPAMKTWKPGDVGTYSGGVK